MAERMSDLFAMRTAAANRRASLAQKLAISQEVERQRELQERSHMSNCDPLGYVQRAFHATSVHPDDFRGPRSDLRFYIYDLPGAANREILVQLHGRIRESAAQPSTCDYGLSPCNEMHGTGMFGGMRVFAAEATILAKLLSAPDEVIVKDPTEASFFVVPFFSSAWPPAKALGTAPYTPTIIISFSALSSAAVQPCSDLAMALLASAWGGPLAAQASIQPRPAPVTARATAATASRPLLSGSRPGLALACAAGTACRRSARRVLRRALPEVKLNTTRPDLWDGSVMVLFLRSQDGKAQLGRIGTYLDKVSTSGKLQKLIDDTGFTASPATSELLEVSDKGLQRVLLVGLGAKDAEDWAQAGSTAGASLATIEGSASLVCIDGVEVQQLIEGLLSSLGSSGLQSVELLGAYPAGSGAAIEEAVKKSS
ncbi:unnamed protein product [Symbiodinium sp. CCMP2592]|nr:unnamed protein product [Symbiodinium sp. CCMP2592]